MRAVVAWSALVGAAACTDGSSAPVLVTPASGGVAPTSATSSFREDPIVFVHGCPLPKEAGGSVTNQRTASLWRTMYEGFRARGYPAAPWSDPGVIPTSAAGHPSSVPAEWQYLNVLVLSEGPGGAGACGSNIAHARELAAYVDAVRAATHSRRVDIIANSMGGLAARWYMKPVDTSLDPERFPTFGGARYVRDFVMLATPNHGTAIALLAEPDVLMVQSPNYDAARESSPPYNCDPSLDPFQRHLNGCEGADTVVDVVTDDETTDESLVRVSYLNIYNPVFDELVHPAESACLNQKFPNDCSDTHVNRAYQVPGSSPHGDIRFDPNVFEMTYAHVTSRKATKP